MRNWTPEQQQAINARGASFLVSAAAGSGKTSVLVERLIRQLTDPEHPVSAARLAVVTFTNDAAAEMKSRLEHALTQCIAQDPRNVWLRQQQSQLQCAKICTIHSFCFDLIRDHCAELDITPTFRILEETEMNMMVSRGLADIMEAWYADPARQGDMQLLCNRFSGRTDAELENLLTELYRCVMGLPFGLQRMEQLTEQYRNDTFVHMYLDNLGQTIAACIQRLDEAIRLSAEVNQEKLTAFLVTEQEQLTLLQKACTEKDPDRCAALLNALSFASFPRVTKTCTDPEKRELAKALRDDGKKIMKDLQTEAVSLLCHRQEDLDAHCRLIPVLHGFLQQLDDRLWEMKCDKNAIGFTDAEQLALSLLGTCQADGTIQQTALAKELSDFYQIIMIDEFQDTNNKQDLIFKLISHKGSAVANGDNLFMVGDVKQAIYRFRLANPRNFIRTMQACKPYTGKDDGENACILLNRNFRSSPEVIAMVNFLFSTLMTPQIGEVAYTSEEALHQGAAFAETPRNTEIALLEDGEQDTNPEAAYIAKRIARMLREGAPVSDGANHIRPCTPRDFCILMRNKAKGSVYVQALAEQGVAAYSEEAAAYLKAREITLLLNLLLIIDNPPQDTAMAAVLLSPMFRFDMDELTQLRLLAPKVSLYAAICRGIGETGVADAQPLLTGAMYEKTKGFYNALQAFRMYAMQDTPERLIRRIYESTDFLSVMQRYSDGAKKQANLRLMLTYARNYETASGGGLSGFLHYIAQVSARGKDFQPGTAVSGSEDVVAIKTIHKSKGLEFPFVFLAESETDFNHQDDRAAFQFLQEYGFGFRLQDPAVYTRYKTLPYAAISMQRESYAKSEELRLLYVALTRAKDKLFLPLRLNDARKKQAFRLGAAIAASGRVTPSIAASANCMADWLWMALLTAENAAPLREACQMPPCHLQPAVPMEILHPEDSSDATEQDTSTPAAYPKPDPAMVTALRMQFAAVYDDRLMGIPSKTSVSALSKDEDAVNLALRRPRFMAEETALTGAEKGTALHAFLQYADFAVAAQDPDAERQRLTEDGHLTRRQADSLDLNRIRAFFASPLYERIRQAEHVWRERKFLVRISDLQLPDQPQYNDTNAMLSGIMDLVFEEPDGLVLVDYKTDYVQGGEMLTERYQRQLLLYRRTLALLHQKPVKETVLYSFHLNRAIPLPEEAT